MSPCESGKSWTCSAAGRFPSILLIPRRRSSFNEMFFVPLESSGVQTDQAVVIISSEQTDNQCLRGDIVASSAAVTFYSWELEVITEISMQPRGSSFWLSGAFVSLLIQAHFPTAASISCQGQKGLRSVG